MNELNNDIDDDAIANEYIDPDLIFYSTRTINLIKYIKLKEIH